MGVRDRKEREFQRREQDLLRAALALSNRDHWQSVTIDEVAQKTEIGKGTVYKHFKSKDDLYARLALDFHRLVLARVRAVEASGSALDELRGIIKAFWEVYGTHSEYQRVVEYCQRPDFRRLISAELRTQLDEVDAGFASAIDAVMRRGIEEGVLPERPIPTLLFGAQSALYGALRLLWLDCLPGPKEQYLGELTAFILAGLSRPASRGKRPH
jgi:AcrR family transcriptional regulator